jgi:DNA replication protein DnaC
VPGITGAEIATVLGLTTEAIRRPMVNLVQGGRVTRDGHKEKTRYRLASDELLRRGDRLIERRVKHAAFRDTGKTLDAFDFDFNKKMDRRLVFELATARFVTQHEDALLLGPPGTGKSHIAQAIGHAAIQQGHRVLYREAHVLLEDLAQATLEGTRSERLADLALVPLLIIDDLGMRKLPASAAEDLLELVMRRYERASTVLTSNRPVEDWGKLLGDNAAVSAMLDRLLHSCIKPTSSSAGPAATEPTAPACQTPQLTSRDLSSPASPSIGRF